MKKLFPEKKLTKKSILEFLDKKGFYLVLILCVAVIGVTAFIVTSNNITSSNEDYNAEKIIPEDFVDDFGEDYVTDTDVEPNDTSPIDVAAVQTEQKPEAGESTTAQKTETTADQKASGQESGNKAVVAQKDTVAQNNTAAQKDQAAAVQKNDTSQAKAVSAQTSDKTSKKSTGNANNQKFIMPVIGEIILPFAQDRLVYSKTLEEWRTHSGVDIAAERGTPVKAVADGVVSEINHDPRFGITVIIDHQNGLKTVYANLASDEMVNPNQIIKQGDVIGSVGNTALFESLEQSHLHFEVLKDNEPVDPEKYLPVSGDKSL